MNMTMITYRSLSILLGAVFLLSAVAKMMGLDAFGGEVRLYLDTYFNGLLSDYSLCVAGLICMAELLAGICCLVPSCRRYVHLAIFALLTLFIYLTGDNYFHPSATGRIESCGCFGEWIHFTPLGSFIKSSVLWGIALVCLVAGRKEFVK